MWWGPPQPLRAGVVGAEVALGSNPEQAPPDVQGTPLPATPSGRELTLHTAISKGQPESTPDRKDIVPAAGAA